MTVRNAFPNADPRETGYRPQAGEQQLPGARPVRVVPAEQVDHRRAVAAQGRHRPALVPGRRNRGRVVDDVHDVAAAARQHERVAGMQLDRAARQLDPQIAAQQQVEGDSSRSALRAGPLPEQT